MYQYINIHIIKLNYIAIALGQFVDRIFHCFPLTNLFFIRTKRKNMKKYEKPWD